MISKGRTRWKWLVKSTFFEFETKILLDSNQSYNRGHIFIINRENGQIICSYYDAHSHAICGVQVYNDILATADFWGFIKFHHIGTAQPVLLNEENRYHEGGFSHLDHDGDKLVSVSINEFVAWDFITGEKFCILGTAKAEQSTLRL